MRYLFFTNTPAHVHLYRNLVPRLQERGHEVLLLGRDYGCTVDLLTHYDLPYTVYGGNGTSFRSLVGNLPTQFFNVARIARRYDPDVIFGRGAYAAFAGRFTRAPVVLVLDSDGEPIQLGHTVSSWFAHLVLTPEAFDGDLGDHHHRFRGHKECAYLDPDVYTPDPGVRRTLGVDPSEPYAIVRFNAFDSYHDVGASGASERDRRRLLERLADRVTVFVSDEDGTLDLSPLPVRRYDARPWEIHDALAEARLLVTETGTMATEATLLGTPTVRFHDESEPDMGEFEALERNGLLRQRSTFTGVIEEAERLLDDPTAEARWEENREGYLDRTDDLTALLLEVAENHERRELPVEAATTGTPRTTIGVDES